MNLYLALALIVAAFLAGWFRSRRNTRRMPNPQPHAAADSEYIVARLNGDPHAFTAEAVSTARSRAIRLEIE
jgi:hypothetical protein